MAAFSVPFVRPASGSVDLQRILAIPEREFVADPNGPDSAWTYELLTPRGKALRQQFDFLAPDIRAQKYAEFAREMVPLRFTPDQAAVIVETFRVGGAYVLAPVGAGKTLMLFVIATLAERLWGIKNIILLLPAFLYDDTVAAHEKYREFWIGPSALRIVNYDYLQVETHSFDLCTCAKCTNDSPLPDDYTKENWQPGMLLLDEVDVTKDPERAAGSRVGRYKANHLHVPMVGMTGTGPENSLQELAHHMAWFLRPEHYPLPFDWQEMRIWKAGTDVVPGQNGQSDPSYLVRAFGGDSNDPDVRRAARRAIGSKLRKTPGFIALTTASTDVPLRIKVTMAPRDPVIEAEILRFRGSPSATEGGTYEALDGHVLTPGLEAHGYITSVGCGFYPIWDPRPPEYWTAARKEYAQAVSEVIARTGRRALPIETERQARRFLVDEYARWRDVEITFKPNPKSVALSLSVVLYVRDWLRANGPCLVWVADRWLGETLEKVLQQEADPRLRAPYIDRKGQSKTKRRPVPGVAMIASVDSNFRGRNWQAWPKMLFVGAESTNKKNEQAIGRAHRQGVQSAVEIECLATCGEDITALNRACARAGAVEDFFLFRGKLLTAEWDWSALNKLQLQAPDEGFKSRWLTRNKEQET